MGDKQRHEARAGLARLSRAHPALRAAILEAEGRWYVAATEQAGGGGDGGGGGSGGDGGGGSGGKSDGRGRDEKLAARLAAAFGGSGGSDGGDGGGGGGGGKACMAAVGEGAPHSASAWVALLREHGVAAVELCSLATLRERHFLNRLSTYYLVLTCSVSTQSITRGAPPPAPPAAAWHLLPVLAVRGPPHRRGAHLLCTARHPASPHAARRAAAARARLRRAHQASARRGGGGRRTAPRARCRR